MQHFLLLVFGQVEIEDYFVYLLVTFHNLEFIDLSQIIPLFVILEGYLEV